MKRVLWAHVLLIGGLALSLGGELSAGRSAAANIAASAARAEAAAGDAAGGDGVMTMDVALQVNGTPVTFRGQGECTFTDAGTIYDLPARAWTAMSSADARYVNFASWRLKNDGRELMNLSVNVGGTDHRVSTVKVGDQGRVQGSGASTFTKTGPGGTFTIDATSDKGAKISGKVSCSAFAKPEDNG